MKSTIIVTVFTCLVSLLVLTGCPHPIIDPVPTPKPTNLPTPAGAIMLIDDMEDGNNRINSGSLDFTGGYWFTYDDLAVPNNGTSIIWPMTETAMVKYNYPPNAGLCPVPVATFQMSAPNVQGNIACARVSGLARDNTSIPAGFQYGFVGFGFDLNVATPNPTPNAVGTPCPADQKVTTDLVAKAYAKLHFIAKNGPSVTGSKAWKVKLVSSAHGFTDSCDAPIKSITVTDTWQAFDLTISSFAQEGWCSTTGCGCFATADFMAACIGFQFQTGYTKGAVDLLIDDVYLVK